MNKTIFTGLIFMMLFSLVGITWVQLTYIKNAVGIRNENFDYYVSASIQQAANSIESSRKMKMMFPGFNPWNDTLNDLTGYITMNSISSGNGGNVNIRITNQSVTQEPGKEPRIVTFDTTYSSDSTGSVIRTSSRNGDLVIIKSEGKDSNKSDSVFVSQNQLVDWIRKRGDEFRNMSDQMISEVYQWEKTMDVSNSEVENALRESLAITNIQTPFEFALIKGGKVAEGTYKKSSRNDFIKSRYKVRLFPDNFVSQDLIVSVVFPERTNYVLGSMAGILGGSLLFSLIILATFALSLYLLIRQKKVSEMKSDFINNMTHEFKTPIATISLAADTITNPKVIKDEPSIRHFIDMIKKENSRMNKKVETILQIASLDKKEINFKFENISLHQVIEHAVEIISIQVQQKNGSVKLNLNAHEPVIYGDEEHLFNLVNNLLDNAIKYSADAPDITVDTINTDKGILFSVSDKGIGMSKSVQTKIFERFYRQTSGNVHDVKGFGLGLNYARAIVEAHHGRIDVTSEPGRGSRFDVYLPFNWEEEK